MEPPDEIDGAKETKYTPLQRNGSGRWELVLDREFKIRRPFSENADSTQERDIQEKAKAVVWEWLSS
jgi:hypothetical protein